MSLLIAIAAFPLAIAITFFVLARLNIQNPLYAGIDADPDTRRCPLCHKIQDPIAAGVYTCPQCKSELMIKDDLIVRFLSKENQKIDLSVLKPFLCFFIIAILPIYYIGYGITYGIRNVIVFLSPFSFCMARLGLKYGVVGARFGRIYRSETPKAFYLTVAIWYAGAVMLAFFFILDVWRH
jgi:hypothetical protein